MEGWVKIHRKICDTDLWTCEPFSRGQAWVDLIILANYEPGFIYVRGNKIDIGRGQVGWSEKRLSERWRWSRNKVRKFLNDLEKEQQIKQHKTFITQVVTVNNYELYQEKGQQKDSRRTAEGQQKDTKKKEKKEKNKKEIYKDFDFFDDDFEKVWDSYLEMRVKIKKPATDKAEELALREVDKLSNGNKSTAIEIVNQSVLKSWQGIFPLKQNGFDNKPQQNQVRISLKNHDYNR